jgi:hypothetical protein
LDKKLFGHSHVFGEKKIVEATGNRQKAVETVARDWGSLQNKKGNVCRTKRFA